MYISENQFLRDIYIEHMQSIGELLTANEIKKDNQDLFWFDFRDDELRLEAHLDAIKIGKRFAFDRCIEAVETGDEYELSGAVFSLGSTEFDKLEFYNEIIDKFSNTTGEDILTYAIALNHAKHPKISKKLFPLLQHENPLIRAATAEILGYRGDTDPKRIWPLFHDEDESVQIAAMVAMMRLGFKEALPAMEQTVLSSKENFNEHCVLPLLVLGSQKALNFCRTAIHSKDYIKPQYAIYLALAGNESDINLLLNAAHFPDMLTPVIEALGIMGSLSAVGFLMEQMQSEDNEVKLAAAKAMNMISGADLKETVTVIEKEEPDLRPEEITGKPGSNEEKNEGDEREVEIVQDCTDPQRWSEWWQQNNARFDPSQRYRQGKPYSLSLCLEEIAHPESVYNDRQRAFYEVTIRSGHYIPFEPDWFVDKQLEALNEWQEWWNNNKTRFHNPYMFAGS